MRSLSNYKGKKIVGIKQIRGNKNPKKDLFVKSQN